MSPSTRRGSVLTAVRLTGKLVNAWRLVVKRSLANWRLLSSVVLGVLLASAIMASTVIYFEALRELALKRTLAQHTDSELNITVQAHKGPVSAIEYRKVSSIIEAQINESVGWLLRGDPVRAGKTPTMFLTSPGQEARAGEGKERSYIAFMPRLSEHVTLLQGGRLPRDERLNAVGLNAVGLNAVGEPPEFEALIPKEAAELFEVGVGDVMSAVPTWDSKTPHVAVRTTGVFQRTDPDADIWEIERTVLQADTGEGFRTVPFHVTESAFKSVLGPAFPRMVGAYAWLLEVDAGRLNAKNAGPALFGLDSMNGLLTNTIPGYSQTTILDDALEEYDRRIFFSKLPMFVVLILIAVVILYYVASLSALIVEDRRSEIALLRSRGANSSQILTVFALEGATIAVLAVVGGPVLAAASISLLGYTPVLDDLTGGARLLVAVSDGAYLMSALGGLLAFVALMFPAIQASRIGVTRQRQQAARPARRPAFQRYYIDVLLLLVGIYLFRQLTEQGSVLASDLLGDVAVNQLLLALPGLVLVASAMVLLRLFPAAMGLASRVLSPRLPVGMVMGLWQMARNPTHYARLSLLLILTAGLGIFASSFGATLQLSFEQRVLYATGSDIRVQGVGIVNESRPFTGRGRRFGGAAPTPTPTPAARPVATPRPAPVAAYEQVADVHTVSPVHRTVGLDLSENYGTSFSMLAVEGETFDDVAWFRDDFSSRPFESLLKSLIVSDPPPGILLGEDARFIRVRLKPDQPRPSVRVTARVKDVNGWYKNYPLGTLESGEWVELETTLTQPDVPLTLISVAVSEIGGGGDVLRSLQEGSILVDGISITTDGGDTRTIENFDDVEEWSVLRVETEAVSDVLRAAESSAIGDAGLALFSWSEGAALRPRGIFYGQLNSRLPVLASESFVRSTGHKVGEEFDTRIAGTRVPVRLAGTVSFFPTMTDPSEKLLVAELSTLASHVNLGASNPGTAADAGMGPNELWISSTTAGKERELLLERLQGVRSYTKTSVADRAERIANTKADPLVEAGWKALLFLTFGAVFILSCLGYVIHAYVSFRNRQLQFAMLRTVGLSMRQLVAMLWVEQVLVIATGMALGTWMGGRLGATIMPFLGHDDWGDEVVPPFIMQVNWGALLTTYAAMILVFAVVSLALLIFIQRISLQRVLRLGEM